MMQFLKSSRFNAVGLLAVLLAVSVAPISAAGITYYVSPQGNDASSGDSPDKPFATLQQARDAIRTLKMSGGLTEPVTVNIRGGLYELTDTLVFTREDSGTRAAPITYQAYKNETPVISGGRTIEGDWQNYQGEIKVCTIPEVKSGEWNFRQLFLNGDRQRRSRMPNEGFYRVEKGLEQNSFKYDADQFKTWKNLKDVEVVLIHLWNESRLYISEVHEAEQAVVFTGLIGRRVGASGGNRYYIENALEGIDQPGEWALDRQAGKLYYWPKEAGALAKLRAPAMNELVRFEGDVAAKNHVEFVTIRGLTFCNADFTLPDEGIPTIRDPGDIWFPSAVTLKGVTDCVFENNTIRNVGTYALDLTGDGNLITANHIYDTGSGGIITRSYGKHRNIISYNHVHDCGSVFPASVGINIDDGGGLIANNLLHDTSHSGIYARHFSTSYGQEHERRNQEQGLIIEYNEIHDAMHGMNDGGGIFIRDDYVVIRNNLIYDIWSYPGGQGSPAWGIYLGCDTRNCLVENNVVYRAMSGQMAWHGQKNNTIFNNIFVDGSEAQYCYTNPSDLKHERLRFLRNIVTFSGPKSVLYLLNGERSVPLESDYNLLFHTQGKEFVIEGLPETTTFNAWKQRGYDTHSVVADPLFVDPKNDDYSLRPDSPALKLGFKPIDLSRVGLRGRGHN